MHVPYFLSSESLSNLSSALQKVAEIIIAYPIKIEKMSISELATASGVSPATVTKFCRTLGFDDFNSFKLEIAKFNARISFLHKEEEADSMEGRIHRSFVRSVRVLEQTRSSVELEAFQAAAEAIEKADEWVSKRNRLTVEVKSLKKEDQNLLKGKDKALKDKLNNIEKEKKSKIKAKEKNIATLEKQLEKLENEKLKQKLA